MYALIKNEMFMKSLFQLARIVPHQNSPGFNPPKNKDWVLAEPIKGPYWVSDQEGLDIEQSGFNPQEASELIHHKHDDPIPNDLFWVKHDEVISEYEKIPAKNTIEEAIENHLSTEFLVREL